jgi:hypothetical protein
MFLGDPDYAFQLQGAIFQPQGADFAAVAEVSWSG